MIAQESGGGEMRQRRRTVRLDAALEKALSAYACAAAGAGVTLLALGSSAEARIVYTPANTIIPVNGGPVTLDLNQDRITDFSLLNATVYFSDGFSYQLQARPAQQGNAIWGKGSFSDSRFGFRGGFASALRRGFRVRQNKSYFLEADALMALDGGNHSSTGSAGQWLYTKHRYLGLKFMVGGDVHYGWARFNVTVGRPSLRWVGIIAVLTGYSYETIPNKPIMTGKTKGPDVVTLEPASLGHLAQGASGISAWRKSGGSWKSAAH